MAETYPTNLSFQVPDLLVQTNAFTFRTNNHTKRASDASESWLLGASEPSSNGPELTDLEKAQLRGAKYGLLAGLSCPTCDFPQLRLLADFLSLALISHGRITDESYREWLLKLQDPTLDDPFELLDLHPLFKSLTAKLRRSLLLLPAEKRHQWACQLGRSVRLHGKSQKKVYDKLTNNEVPTLAEYIIILREAHASSMFWDIVELLEITPRPTGRDQVEHGKLEQITRCAVDVVAWAIDTFAFAAPTRCNSHNLITLLTKYKKLSVQGAMNFAGGMIKERLEEFHHLERQLLPPANEPDTSSWSWIWSIPSTIGLRDDNSQGPPRPYLSGLELQDTLPLGDSRPAATDIPFDVEEDNSDQVARYISALKDYIIGSIHWGYETELYFGLKGEEIRSFGWVFLNST